jgi:hypothetical protein
MRVLTPLAASLMVLMGSAEASAGLQSALRTYYWGSPVANYNPHMGNITLTNFETFQSLVPLRRFEILAPGAVSLIDEAQVPSAGAVELLSTADGIAWSAPAFPKPFDAGNVVPPGTPVGSLVFQYGVVTGGTYAPVTGTINLVPEPSALAIAACCSLGIALIRRRSGGNGGPNQSGHPCQ